MGSPMSPQQDPHLGRLGRCCAGVRGDRLVGHEGGNNTGEFCFTLPVTDIATGVDGLTSR
jgi:hypothetical protein